MPKTHRDQKMDYSDFVRGAKKVTETSTQATSSSIFVAKTRRRCLKDSEANRAYSQRRGQMLRRRRPDRSELPYL